MKADSMETVAKVEIQSSFEDMMREHWNSKDENERRKEEQNFCAIFHERCVHPEY
jgi:hypothetical protein